MSIFKSFTSGLNRYFFLQFKMKWLIKWCKYSGITKTGISNPNRIADLKKGPTTTSLYVVIYLTDFENFSTIPEDLSATEKNRNSSIVSKFISRHQESVPET